MYRIQVQLSETEHAFLRDWAKHDRISMNSIVRSLIRNMPPFPLRPLPLQRTRKRR